MSYENKGSFGPTVKVTREPDRSGNFVCDGTADDVQIQEALDYIGTLGGGTVLVGRGQYNLTNTILMADNGVEFIGSGMWEGGTKFFLTAGTNLTVLEITGIKCRIAHFKIDANKTNNGSPAGGQGYGIHSHGGGAEDLAAHNIFIFNAKRDGWFFAGSAGQIHECYTEYADLSGWNVTGDRSRFTSCIAAGNVQYGWNIITSNSHFANCNSGSNGFAGWILKFYGNGYPNGFHGCGSRDNDSHGWHLYGTRNNILNGCWSANDGQSDNNTRDGFYLQNDGTRDTLDNQIVDCQVYTRADNKLRYCINEDDANQQNIYMNNLLDSNAATGIARILCPTSKIHTAQFQFTEPIVGVIVTTSPTGIEVDVDTEQALAWGQLPAGLQEVQRIKVWAVALDAPVNAGGQMHCEFTFNAGASNAAYNEAGKSWNLVNFDSEEADYVANDVIHWLIEDGDVSNELMALVARDSFEMFAIHEAAADPDGATDAVFRVVEVDYV